MSFDESIGLLTSTGTVVDHLNMDRLDKVSSERGWSVCALSTSDARQRP